MAQQTTGPERRPGEREPSARLSREAFERLSEELEKLRTEGRDHIAERLLRAREFGDIRENAEYDAAKNEQGLMEARIRKLQAMLKDAEIVEASALPSDTVVTGMVVTVRPRDEDDGDDERYLLAVSPEERPAGMRTVTPDSPFGSALLGRRIGEVVEYEAPGGTFEYEVVGFEPYQP